VMAFCGAWAVGASKRTHVMYRILLPIARSERTAACDHKMEIVPGAGHRHIEKAPLFLYLGRGADAEAWADGARPAWPRMTAPEPSAQADDAVSASAAISHRAQARVGCKNGAVAERCPGG